VQAVNGARGALFGLFKGVGTPPTVPPFFAASNEEDNDEASPPAIFPRSGGDETAPAEPTPVARSHLSAAEQIALCQADVSNPVANTNGQSLFCWALTVPGSYEVPLLAFQSGQAASIFGCDEYTVYSNQVINIVADLTTTMVDVDLHCEKGGEFGTALNTRIFVTIWSVLIDSCKWLRHDWTVKADPDTVFFPHRLRQVLPRHAQGERGTYINNCNRGMHGPIEVFSRLAVEAWWEGHLACRDHFAAVCGGRECEWGEDMFIDQCLSKVLGVRQEYDGDMLLEENCDPPPGWRSCSSPGTVAFHPFKDIGEYQTCLQQGQSQVFR
jgi:hypothetical protein